MSRPVAEEWRKVVSFPAYSVSSFGRVRRDDIIRGGGGSTRIPSGVLATRPLPLGHLQVTLSMNNKPRTFLVHRLVAEAFLPPPEATKDCVCHKDDDPSNNDPSNLFWGDRVDNSDDKVSKQRQARGERITSAKLTADLVAEIRERVGRGEDQYDLAATFGVSQSNISMIASRKTWKHVP